MDVNPLLKYMMKAKKEDVVHSSGYAMAQNKGIGAASTSSFEQRQKMEGNRTRVKGYRDSAIASRSVNVWQKPKTYTPPEPNAGLGQKPALGQKQPPTSPINPGISR